jgi:hypothetical protein
MFQSDYLVLVSFPICYAPIDSILIGFHRAFGGAVSVHDKPGIHVAWKQVTYRSVLLMLLAGMAIFSVGLHFAFPQFTEKGVQAAENFGSHLLETIGAAGAAVKTGGSAGSQQAHFTALDGTVRVKKANSNSWTPADYSVPLEKGDVVQTSSEGMAKIVFSDGTNYTVKQDSLIVVEENSANDNSTTNVTVAVSTGTVDLATATYSQGSRSQVTVAGATASLAPDSAAMVHNDPSGDDHEILVKRGSGEVTRNGETVHLADWEKVNFQQSAPRMEKQKEIGPPTPISPANMTPIFVSKDAKPIEFSWTAMANAASYRLRISRNPYFSSTIVDRQVKAAAVMVSGLEDGAYYWMVQSVDNKGNASIESEKNRFTLIVKDNDATTIGLDLDPLIQHGHVLELTGKTEMGARVMVNGHEVPMVSSDGSFHFFTPPLPSGENTITITAQDTKGGVNTVQKKVVIQ